MMKNFYFAVIAMAALTLACSTEDSEGNGTGNGNGNGTDTGNGNETYVENADGTFTYHGATYKTVTLSNGSVWMAEPLRHVPEGFTPSADPEDDNAHIWYPYENADGTAAAVTDEGTIAEKGYLYDMYAALGGKEVTADNAGTFEGAQGICPPGWHIPTRAEFFALCGLSNKNQDESGNQINENALFYDSTYGGGKLTLYNDAGWNYVLSGVRMKSNFGATGRYQATWLSESNSSLTESIGEPALTYIMSSTPYQVSTNDETGEITNIQFFAQMTTFSKTYPEGRVNIAYISTMSGQQLRCVKDAQ